MAELPQVAPEDVQRLLDRGWCIVDVRTEGEWARGRIEGSEHLPLDQLLARLGEVPGQVIFVCAVGARSAQATAYLRGHGHDAINLAGGLQAWVAAGLPLTR